MRRARQKHAWWDTRAPSEGAAWLQVGVCSVLVLMWSLRLARGEEEGWSLVAAIAIVVLLTPVALMSIPTALWLRRTAPPPEEAEPEPSVWPFSDDR